MKRVMMLVVAAAAVAVMMMTSAMPALAQGPQTVPPGAQFAVPNVLEHNPVIGGTASLLEPPVCLTLNAPPGRSDIGHHSDFPDFCSTTTP